MGLVHTCVVRRAAVEAAFLILLSIYLSLDQREAVSDGRVVLPEPMDSIEHSIDDSDDWFFTSTFPPGRLTS